MKKIISSLLIAVFALLFFSPSLTAGTLPSGVQPLEGRASGIIEEFGGKIQYEYTITFYNVGEMGGQTMGKATLTIKNIKKDTSPMMKNAEYINGTFEGIFSGGPNGEIRFGNDLKKAINTQLAIVEKGANIQISGVGKIPVENPGIFSAWDKPVSRTAEPDEADSGPIGGIGEDSGAAFSYLDGQVEVNYPQPDGSYDEEDWHFAKLEEGQTLPVGTHIRTSDKSGAIISSANLSTFMMKPNTEIIIFKPQQQSEIKLLAGKLWSNVKKMAKEGSLEIEMSQAVAGIKGTTFVLEETGDTSTLKVFEGSVEFTSKANGQKVMVAVGEMLLATKDGLQAKQSFDASKEQADWDSFKTKVTTAGQAAKAGAKQFPYLWVIAGIVLLAAAGGLVAVKSRKNKANV